MLEKVSAQAVTAFFIEEHRKARNAMNLPVRQLLPDEIQTIQRAMASTLVFIEQQLTGAKDAGCTDPALAGQVVKTEGDPFAAAPTVNDEFKVVESPRETLASPSENTTDGPPAGFIVSPDQSPAKDGQ